MHVRRSALGLEVLAPAKLNLFLEVVGKRVDGFHEIETLMYPIALWDSVRFVDDASGKISLTCRMPRRAQVAALGAAGPTKASMATAPTLPQGPDNLVTRAVELLKSVAGVDRGARIHLVKRIPLAAGLAGGSSDAAAALVAANRGWRLGWPLERLRELAAELGSDVPFFLGSGPAVCTGRGELISPAWGLGLLHLVVHTPPQGLSTADVYRACTPSPQPQTSGRLLAALRRGDLAAAGKGIFNRLQPAAEVLSPWIARLSEKFAQLDFLGHGMSGSGTSYFGLCRHAAHARRLAARLRQWESGMVAAVCGCRGICLD